MPKFNDTGPSAVSPPPNYDAEAGGVSVKVGTAETAVRLGFLRKVYTILTINFGITVLFACFFSFVIPVRDYVARNWWLVLLGIVIVIASFFAMACLRVKPPWNVLLLGCFVLGFSLMIGTICAAYFKNGWGAVVLQAFCATAATFVAITAYVLITKKDFSYLGAFLFGALITLIVLSVLTFAVGLVSSRLRRWLAFTVSVFGALLMVGYLLYDTSLVVHRYGPDEWLIAVICLYTDVSNLFLYLLSIFSFVQG